jgi:hypothetical protein
MILGGQVMILGGQDAVRAGRMGTRMRTGRAA